VTVDAPERSRPPGNRRRRPGPPAAPVWRFGYPVLLAGLCVLALVLSATGARLVLDSRDGQVGRSEQDPTKPGYLEAVSATPLLLVVHADVDRNLYGVTLMTLGENDTGGWAVFMSPDTVVSEDGSLADIYEDFGQVDATSGKGVRAAVSALFKADVDTTVTLDATSLAPLIEPVAPLRYTLAEPVRVTRNGRTTTVLDAGEVAIATADEISAATEALGTGTPSDRLDRQSAFWNSWMDAVGQAPAGAFPAASTDTPLARFVRGLSAARTITHLPTVTYDGLTVADTDTLTGLLADIVPYPRQEGVRLNVTVLNGVGELSLNAPMERRLVAAGAQIASRGNPEAFDVATTSVVYHDEAIAPAAQALGHAIGATDVRFEAKGDSEVQVTVTIGADFDPTEQVPTTSTGAPR
jgi:hypothetical protein